MLISGIQRFTTIDFPGKIACVVFTAGCNLRCGYCHNSEFVLPEKLQKLVGGFVDTDAVMHFLEQRKERLEGVVISGGEPTMMPDLLDFMRSIKEQGYLVKLDTNGTHPEVIQGALEQGVVDYLAMDIKAPLGRYAELVGVAVSEEVILESIERIKESGVDYEFRSVLIKGFHSDEDIAHMRGLVAGSKRYRLLSFRPQNTLCPAFALHEAFSDDEMRGYQGAAGEVVDEVLFEGTNG